MCINNTDLTKSHWHIYTIIILIIVNNTHVHNTLRIAVTIECEGSKILFLRSYYTLMQQIVVLQN